MTIGRAGASGSKPDRVLSVWDARDVVLHLARDEQWPLLSAMAAELTGRVFLAPERARPTSFVDVLVSAIERGDVVVRAGWQEAAPERPPAAQPAAPVAPAEAAPPARVARAREVGWIAVDLVDELGERVATAFRLEMTDGRVLQSTLGAHETITESSIPHGACHLALPQIDERCRRVRRLQPAREIDGARAYVPGQALSLETDASHRVVVPALGTLWVEVPLDMDEDAWLHEHRFVLRSNDGAYEGSHTVAPASIGSERLLSLSFEDVFFGPTYTLMHDRGDEGAHAVFAEQRFETLFPVERTDPEDLQRLAHAVTPGGGAARDA